jgi:rubrerythrin
MRHVCRVCGYIYDDSKEVMPFEALPEDWTCPLCGAPKSEFAPEGAGEAATKPTAPVDAEADLKELSAGQLAALCSNLARGCEKQYKERESELFRQLADYFTAITPAVDDANVQAVASLLQGDVERYAGVRAVADAASDRGAARACVWGEKVTRMLSSLVNRYLKEGEAMLADTNVWVCTACGFVYVGDSAPELCPVCKVPAWKFERIERGM